MRKRHAPLAGGPLQDVGVRRLHEGNILHADKLEFGMLAQQAAEAEAGKKKAES